MRKLLIVLLLMLVAAATVFAVEDVEIAVYDGGEHFVVFCEEIKPEDSMIYYTVCIAKEEKYGKVFRVKGVRYTDEEEQIQYLSKLVKSGDYKATFEYLDSLPSIATDVTTTSPGYVLIIDTVQQ